MRTLLRTLLETHQYETVFAADAVQAIAVARKTQPDAIILDLGLPGGNGFLVLQRLKSISQVNHIPVIILTADQGLESESKALAGGATVFLRKPLQDEALLAAVNRVTGAAEEGLIADAHPNR